MVRPPSPEKNDEAEAEPQPEPPQSTSVIFRFQSDHPPKTPTPTTLFDGEEEVELTRFAEESGPPSGHRSVYQPRVERILVDVAADEAPTIGPPRFVIKASARTDPGRRRRKNEDRFLVVAEENLYVVADGMGGHHGGDLASQIATEAMALATATKTYDGAPHDAIPVEASELARAIQMANAEIRDAVAKKPAMDGMGTTVVAARFVPEQGRLYVGHVGDSRCYRLRDDVLTQMTTDHTMGDLGVTGPNAVALSRAVGIWSTTPIDVLLAVPNVGDTYLLCSDGLTKMLSDEAILSILRTEEELEGGVEQLISFANAHGGRDNITAILMRVMPAPVTPP